MVGQMIRVLSRRWALTIIIVVALEGGVFWGAFTFVGADLHQRFGLGFAAIGLAVTAFGAGGFAYVMAAPHLVRLLGERGLCLWGGAGLGLAFAGMALAPSVEIAFAAIALSGVSFYMFHNTLQTHGTQMAPEARGAALALFAMTFFTVCPLPVHGPGHRGAGRRPHRRSLGRPAGVRRGRGLPAATGALVRARHQAAQRLTLQLSGDTRNS